MSTPNIVPFGSAGPTEIGNSTAESPAEQRLRRAATDFESMLLSKWWSAMRDSGLGGLEQTDPGHETLDQLGMQALSTAIAGAGGIGLGAMMVRNLLSNAREPEIPDTGLQTGALGDLSGVPIVPK
jgi:Rod binding domain-containing protein